MVVFNVVVVVMVVIVIVVDKVIHQLLSKGEQPVPIRIGNKG
jgi:hypothetical protein